MSRYTRQVIVHTGLPTCASTNLQSNLFPNINGIQLLSSEATLLITEYVNTFPPVNEMDSIGRIVAGKDADYNCDLRSHKAVLKKKIDQYLRVVDDADLRPLLVSSENLSWNGWNTIDYMDVFKHKCLNLKELFPTAKIVFIHRNITDFIISQWRASFQQRYCQGICEFVLSKEEIVELGENLKSNVCSTLDTYGRKISRPWLYPYGINFDECMSIYTAEFGETNCCFISLEDMKTNLERTIKVILEFTNILPQNDCEHLASIMSSSPPLAQNISIKGGARMFLGYLDKFCRAMNIYIPYGSNIEAEKAVLPNFFYRRLNWLYFRYVLSNKSHISHKLIGLVFGHGESVNPRTLLGRKFPSLV